MPSVPSPREHAPVARGPARVCNHPNRHEFYCWRSREAAVAERDVMARNPHHARLYVSEVYRGSLGGWAWTVCWNCAPLP